MASDTGFLDILAAVAEVEAPLDVQKHPTPTAHSAEPSATSRDEPSSLTSTLEMDVDAQIGHDVKDADEENEDEADLMSLFTSGPPIPPPLPPPSQHDELAALFADEDLGSIPHHSMNMDIDLGLDVSGVGLPPAAIPSSVDASASDGSLPTLSESTTPLPASATLPEPTTAARMPANNGSSQPSPSPLPPPPPPAGTHVGGQATQALPLRPMSTQQRSAQSAVPPPSLPNNAPALLDSLLRQVAPARQLEFLELYRNLQNKVITNDEFLSKAKGLLEVGTTSTSGASPTATTPISYTARPSTYPQLATAVSRGATSTGASRGVAPIMEDMRKRKAEMAAYPPFYSDPSTPASNATKPRAVPPLLASQPRGRPPNSAKESVAQPVPHRTGSRLTAVADPNTDTEAMLDVTAYTGINVREEEDLMNLMPMGSASEMNMHASSSSAQPLVHIPALRRTLRQAAIEAKLKQLSPQLLPYIAQATQQLLTTMITQFIHASKHRTGATMTGFLAEQRERAEKLQQQGQEYVQVRRERAPGPDIRKVLDDIAKRERQAEDEWRKWKEFKTAEENKMEVDGVKPADATAAGDVPEKPKKRKREKEKEIKEKDLPEEIRVRRANEAVAAFLGGKTRSWMTAGATGANSASTPSAATSAASKSSGLGSKQKGAGNNQSGNRKVTLRDALFVLEQERWPGDVVSRWWNEVQ
ncbi:hypothetical protein HDU85_000539 [Gaertneriomyces sp. JEL0708]|nr:hypothetical protein HDU85_000539 [Gaertneriomyces sp. JEL0708]